MTAKRCANRGCHFGESCGKLNAMKYSYNIGDIHNCIKITSVYRNEDGRLWITGECIYCHSKRDMRASDVFNQRTNSCVCRIVKHNMNTSRIYAIYHNMKYRCTTPTAPAYKHYGGRGIKVCDGWLDKESGFQNFMSWAVKNGYSDDLTIDRIDIDGDYTPENCRWISKSLNTGLSNKDHPRKHSV